MLKIAVAKLFSFSGQVYKMFIVLKIKFKMDYKVY